VKYEVIKDENEKRFVKQTTAQIYKDCMYVYGRAKGKGNELWSFDLSMRKVLWEMIDFFFRKSHLEVM